jgi:hypothetical protein
MATVVVEEKRNGVKWEGKREKIFAANLNTVSRGYPIPWLTSATESASPIVVDIVGK